MTTKTLLLRSMRPPEIALHCVRAHNEWRKAEAAAGSDAGGASAEEMARLRLAALHARRAHENALAALRQRVILPKAESLLRGNSVWFWEAEDLAQEVLDRWVLQQDKNFRDGVVGSDTGLPWLAWIDEVTRNCIINIYRMREVRRVRGVDVPAPSVRDESGAPIDPMDLVRPEDSTPSAEMVAEGLEAVRRRLEDDATNRRRFGQILDCAEEFIKQEFCVRPQTLLRMRFAFTRHTWDQWDAARILSEPGTPYPRSYKVNTVHQHLLRYRIYLKLAMGTLEPEDRSLLSQWLLTSEQLDCQEIPSADVSADIEDVDEE